MLPQFVIIVMQGDKAALQGEKVKFRSVINLMSSGGKEALLVEKREWSGGYEKEHYVPTPNWKEKKLGVLQITLIFFF